MHDKYFVSLSYKMKIPCYIFFVYINNQVDKGLTLKMVSKLSNLLTNLQREKG